MTSQEQNVIDHFCKALDQASITYSNDQLDQLYLYYQMLVEKNKVMNLTSITEFDQVYEKHFLDSILLGAYVSLHERKSVLDLGTGAGFPGIPLKIMFPELEVTLADSLNKRVLFLQDVIASLKLTGITAIHERAENLSQRKDQREGYDLVVSRAVANLSTLSEYCLPFVKVGGEFISYKSAEYEEEADQAKNAIFLCGGKLENVDNFRLGDSGRAFLHIRKLHSCPKKYPRKAGTPSKEPL